MGLQLEPHGLQLGSAMWRSLVPLTRAGTVGHGNKYLTAGFWEEMRGKVWRLFMQPPLQSLLKRKQRIGQGLEAFGFASAILLCTFYFLDFFFDFSFFFFLLLIFFGGGRVVGSNMTKSVFYRVV